MVKMLKKIYHKLERFAFVRWLGKVYLNGFPLGNYLAYRRVKRLSKKRYSKDTTRRIRVAFIGQAVSVWEKIAPVYERMVDDNRFEVMLYAVSDITEKEGNSAASYFRSKYRNVVAVDKMGSEDGVAISAFNPDYVFYTRPYDQYLPAKYRSSKVSKYSKVCYCPYSFRLTIDALYLCFAKDFARNVYYFFAENDEARIYNVNRFRKSHKEGVRKSVFVGYPIMGKMAVENQKNCDYFSVLWAPRWRDADETEGGNFFNYKDKMIELAEADEGIRLFFRPHPLAFYHFVQNGRMTQQEVDSYIGRFDGKKKVYDRRADYEETFKEADVLVSDISSMISEFYISGKPIVYCDNEATVLPVGKKLLEGCYKTKNWEETQSIIFQLVHEDDPMKQRRQEISKEVFGQELTGIAERFVECIIDDWKGNM